MLSGIHTGTGTGRPAIDGEMEAAFREVLPHLAPDAPLELDADLFRLGLDSLGMVALVIALEDALGVSLPDELLGPEVFASPAALLAVALDPAAADPDGYGRA